MIKYRIYGKKIARVSISFKQMHVCIVSCLLLFINSNTKFTSFSQPHRWANSVILQYVFLIDTNIWSGTPWPIRTIQTLKASGNLFPDWPWLCTVIGHCHLEGGLCKESFGTFWPHPSWHPRNFSLPLGGKSMHCYKYSTSGVKRLFSVDGVGVAKANGGR